MNLLFFGSSQRQLFGAYHAPPTSRPARGAVLLCAPWGQEYQNSHRINRRLAVQFSEQGYHALRFDYYGTGDSAGDREAGTLATWLEDSNAALTELRDMCGFERVSTFGIRLGAVIAWRLAAMRADIPKVMMWDPVISGSDYLRELEQAQSEIDRWSLTSPPRPTPAQGKNLLGFPMKPDMRASIEQVQPSEFSRATKAHVNIFFSEATPGRELLTRTLQPSGTQFQCETIGGLAPWREDQAVNAGAVPATVLERMAELIG